jgi:hypothetical protein
LPNIQAAIAGSKRERAGYGSSGDWRFNRKAYRESTLINADLQNAVLRVLAVKKSCVKTSPLINTDNTDLQEHD